MTLFFRHLSCAAGPLLSGAERPEQHLDEVIDASAYAGSTAGRQTLQHWLQQYAQRLRRESRPAAAVMAEMLRTNPKYVLRNYLVQTAIEAAETYLARAVKHTLIETANRDYQVVDPALSSIQGAILMALERCGRAIDPALVQRLGETSRTVGAGVPPDWPMRANIAHHGLDACCLHTGNGGNRENPDARRALPRR